MPCERPPYTRTGLCPGYEWGPVRNGSQQSAISPRGYFYRNCTDWVAWRLQKLGISDSKTRGLHNGGQWAAYAPNNGLKVSTAPQPGDAAVRVGNPGHVAFVEAVHGSSITISQYNADKTGTYSIQTGTPSALGFQQFVHFGAKVPATWFERNYNSSGPSGASFGFGSEGDTPLVGNWDGVGGDTVGVFRKGTWYLRNANSAGTAKIKFGYGRSTDIPIVGNWDGVGGDTVGVFRKGTWYLRNYNSSGSSFTSFGFGRSTDIPVVGDWDGNGTDTVGVFRKGTWYLRNSNSSGPSNASFGYGRSTDRPIVGDWDGHIGDTIGVFR